MAWKTEVPHTVRTQLAAPVVSGGTVYYASGPSVTALDASDGSQQWQTQLTDTVDIHGGEGFVYATSVADNQVYVGNSTGLYVLDGDGTEQWSYTVNSAPGFRGVFRPPVVAGDTVYFCTARERTLHAYTTGGTEKWTYKLGDQVIAAPVVGDDRIFVADESEGLHALSTGGVHHWTASVGGIRQTPTLSDGIVYAAGESAKRGHFFTAIDAETGDREWVTDAVVSLGGSPTIVGEYVACPGWSDTVYVFDQETGSVVWGAPVGGSAPILTASDGTSLYVVGDRTLSGLHPLGDVRWQFPLEGIEGGVALTDGALFVCTNDGTCFALSYEEPTSGGRGAGSAPPPSPTPINRTSTREPSNDSTPER